MKKILFVITTLGGGGAERIVSYLANGFCKREDCKVNLLLLKKEGNTYLDSIDEDIKVTNLKLKGRLRFNVLKIVKAIIHEKPNICFIGLDGLNILLAPFIPIIKNHGVRVIVRETNVLSYMWKSTVINRMVYRLFYNNYDNIICQSKDMADDLIIKWRINKDKITLINNPINVDSIIKQSLIPIELEGIPKKPFFISVGRLTTQKGFDTLIDNINFLVNKGKFPYLLLIVGNGGLEKVLRDKIKEYNLENTIFLLGRIENPYRIMRLARGFILSSKFEGFPNVLLEAHSLGLPVFANKCPGGINEIIIDGVNGITADFNDITEFERKFDEYSTMSFDHNEIVRLNRERYDTSQIFPKFTNMLLK